MNPPFSLVDRFGAGLTPLAPAEPVGGGFSGAVVLRVACRGGTFAVRGWPANAEPERIRGLHRLLRHVDGRGVPVAVPLADRRGETLVRHGGRWWQVEPWLPGRADFRESPTEGKLAAAMGALAAFHEAAASFAPAAGEEVWFGGPAVGVAPAVRDRIALLQSRVVGGEWQRLAATVPASGGGEFGGLARRVVGGVRRVGENVLGELRQFAGVGVPLLSCLRDVWREHVLFDGDVVTGLIDPSACRRDTVATDLSRLLGSLLGDDALRWGVAVAAYCRVRPLTADEIALVPMLDRSGVLLSAAAWVRRRYVFGEGCETGEVLARLREVVARVERLQGAR